jgi:ABC-type lipoprotein export system ATPase subunit
MASILRIANLCKTYNITEVIKEDVLKGVNLELNEGEMVAIRGESGCGKSTLLNILGGLDLDYTGSVIIKGNFIRDFSEDDGMGFIDGTGDEFYYLEAVNFDIPITKITIPNTE